MIQEVHVTSKERDILGENFLKDIHHTLGLTKVTDVRTVKIYRLEGVSAFAAELLARALLVEPINQFHSINQPILTAGQQIVEVGYQPGVMNPEVGSIMKSARDLDIQNLIAVDTSTKYHFFGELSKEDLLIIQERLLVNKIVNQVIDHSPTTLVVSGLAGGVSTIPLQTMTHVELLELAKTRQLFLNLEEMLVIQCYFLILRRDPTDLELETLAQTWSEHCSHKTFKARLIVDGKEKEPLMTRIKNAASRYMDNVVSAFEDNSGVLRFYDGWAVLAKVETHNSPSAIEPYGGAMTGSGGVFRDIMGTGQGSKVILSTDMFCVGPPDLPINEVPPGCLHPHYLLRRVVAGVRDYGNRMGIPTSNGSVTFDYDFRAKPTIIVGAYGIALESRCRKGQALPGDKIIAMGGRTGRDGIHGATFSSGEMTADTITVNSTAVQIGNAIEEKRTSDALLICRDQNLIRATTDCGPGGFSSAIGEMAEKTGARVELSKAPLKYSGLAPWEIWISESQERMVCAVAPENAEQFKAICESYNVEATELGEFTDDQTLTVMHDGKTVCELSMEFLHTGLPQREMKATSKLLAHKPSKEIPYPEDWVAVYYAVMSHGDVCSKEPIVRQYDHGVQGTNALPPFTGEKNDGPNDAVVLKPILDKSYGLVQSHGMNPTLMRIAPYNGALWAVTEAMANLVAVGGDPRSAALINNYIWPFPDEVCLGALDLAVQGVCKGMDMFQLPVISGKDSLSSTFRFSEDEVLEIPPVLCISAFGRILDVEKTVSSDFKRNDSQLVFLGVQDIYWSKYPDIPAMDGSIYQSIQLNAPEYSAHEYNSGRVPMVDVNPLLSHMFFKLHEQIVLGNVLACHDISQGGLAATLAEMCFGGNVGAKIDLSKIGPERPDYVFFNETAGCFLVEISADLSAGEIFAGLPHHVIGKTIPDKVIYVRAEKHLCTVAVERLRYMWQQPMKEIFK